MQEGTPLRHVCILGAGSAGIITALTLRTFLPDVAISIMIPKTNKNIGVGESTQPDLVDLIEAAGIDLFDFIEKVDCTLKHGIYYKNWNRVGDNYWHPFTSLSGQSQYTRAHHYHKMHILYPEQYPLSDYYQSVHPSFELCVKNNLSSTAMPYALHIDADKMANYVLDFLGRSIDVVYYDDYFINSIDKKIEDIEFDKNRKIEADLYIDCTGFSRSLSNAIDNTTTDGYEGNVNAAIAARIPYEKIPNNKTIPYTKADAWTNGWIWTIPLSSRLGSGCVYNTNFCSGEEAKCKLVDYWNNQITESDLQKISFSSESLLHPWKNNVVNIGLSAGFIEPLEATGISWFIISSRLLATMLKNRYFDQNLSQRYNTQIRSYIEDVQDFIDTHYMLSNRQDSEFWIYQTSRKRHPRLLARLHQYHNFMPNKTNRPDNSIWAFNDVSWVDILTGYDFKFKNVDIPTEIMKQKQYELFL